MAKITVPIGPQHPLLKEPLSFLITLEGEKVEESALRLGYVHRGIEKLAESRTYIQNIYLSGSVEFVRRYIQPPIARRWKVCWVWKFQNAPSISVC